MASTYVYKTIILGAIIAIFIVASLSQIFNFRFSLHKHDEASKLQAGARPPPDSLEGYDLLIDDWESALQRYLKLPINNAFGSHVIPLLAAAWVTRGDMMELGSGYFSTPSLHLLAKDNDRYMLTADGNLEWLSKFASLKDSFHDLFIVSPNISAKNVPPGLQVKTSWAQVGSERNWSLVFVDQAPALQRVVDLKRLRAQGEIFVVHDTEARAEKHYKLASTLKTFKHRFVFSMQSQTWTDIVSDTRGDLIRIIQRLCEHAHVYVSTKIKKP